MILGIGLLLLTSCVYKQPDLSGWDIPAHTKDSLLFLHKHHYSFNANFEVIADSLYLEQLPLKEKVSKVYKGDCLVVAEFKTKHSDEADTVWVKVAHNQEVQGWILESELLKHTVPSDSISQFIHLFSSKHSVWFAVVLIAFLIYVLVRGIRKKQVKLVYFDDIDSVFPMLLCVLLAFAAMLYGTMQSFYPETWEHFYYNPNLNPFELPLLLGLFVGSVWLIIVVALAVLDDLFHQVSVSTAIFYLLGLSAVCVFCYLFFIYATAFYVGYSCFILLVVLFVWHVRKHIGIYRYRCGCCGAKLRHKGECPHCGAMNV